MEILERKEFDVLVYIEERQNVVIDKELLAKKMNITASALAEIICKLEKNEFIEIQNDIFVLTKEAYEALEPYKVKRAILLAAGLGSRMRPVTLERPKPLVDVHGRVIIETILDTLLEKGIEDITIVTGYLHEQFDGLKEKYKTIKLIYNDKYNKENNISSAMLVKDLYAGAYVMDADLYLMNKDVIRKYEYGSNYLGTWVDQTDDWCFEIVNDKVTNMVYGGENTYLMIGISYWSIADGQQFVTDIEKLYQSEDGKQKYWDDVALTAFNEHYNIHVRECSSDDIIEIDSVAELAQMDSRYEKYIK